MGSIVQKVLTTYNRRSQEYARLPVGSFAVVAQRASSPAPAGEIVARSRHHLVPTIYGGGWFLAL